MSHLIWLSIAAAALVLHLGIGALILHGERRDIAIDRYRTFDMKEEIMGLVGIGVLLVLVVAQIALGGVLPGNFWTAILPILQVVVGIIYVGFVGRSILIGGDIWKVF